MSAAPPLPPPLPHLALSLRLWHWANAALILILASSGASLHFADPAAPWIPFPLAERLHSLAGWGLIVTYGYIVVANRRSRHDRQFWPCGPDRGRRCLRQARYYLWDVFRGGPHPFPPTAQALFNPLQALFYGLVLYGALPVILITGVILLFPALVPKLLFGWAGLMPVATLHYLVAAGVMLFVATHIYLGTMGARVLSLFTMMITGRREE